MTINKEELLRDITPFVYGTTRMGDDSIPVDARVKTAVAAMNAGVWFHTSDQYNTALQTLRIAFEQNKTKIPKLIIKIIAGDMKEFRACIEKNIRPLGVGSVELGQLCLGGRLAEEFAAGGDCYKEFMKIKEEGLVNRYVMEVFPWTSEVPYKALQKGYPEGIVDGYIFYLNPLQRFADNKLWDLICKKNEPVIAMRTVSGGNVHRLRDVPGAAWKDYLQKRAAEVAPVFERSGIKSWTEFCMRFAHSFRQVRSTVGSTARLENLQEFLKAKDNIAPLPDDITGEIIKLQYRWSDETDIHAEPWSM